MKLLLRGIIIVLLVVKISYAQKSPIKFGVVPLEDLKMTVYDKDTSASAVVLADYGHAEMTFLGDIVKMFFDRHVRIKILNKDGLDWANAEIQMYMKDRVQNLKAVTYNLENGKIVETDVSKDAIFKEKFNKNYNIQKFTFPNVKEGSVIEYSYTIASDYIFTFPNWKFQTTIPTRQSEFYAFIPDFCIYEKYMQGYLSSGYDSKRKNSASLDGYLHHWSMTDVPAFKEEPFMTGANDYMSQINFAVSHLNFPGRPVIEIMGSWDKLCSTLNDDEDFGKVITGSSFLKKTVEEITTGMTDEKAKITAIYNYVKTNIEWDGTMDIYADNLKKVVEAKKGTAADLNLMLASMLDKAGFKVEMVLISTKDHGFVRQTYPMARQFNYVVARVKQGDTFVFLDATEKYLPQNLLPKRCLNGEGLIVSKTNKGWANLETKAKSKTTISADLRLEADGGLKGKINYTRDGYAASESRREYFKEGEETYFKNSLAEKLWEVNSSKYVNSKEIDKPAVEDHEIVVPSHASVAGNQIYLNPFVAGQLTENPFKSEQREYPVDFGSPIERVYLGKIIIPDGYNLDEIPQTKIFVLPGNSAKFVYSVNVTGKLISVVSTLQINKSMFTQDEYPNLREFYNQVVAKQNEQLVLKKL